MIFLLSLLLSPPFPSPTAAPPTPLFLPFPCPGACAIKINLLFLGL